jgi:cell division protein FtsL
MIRLNLVLFMVLIMTALGTVTAQHQSRKLYSELQIQQEAAKQYDVEWGQLQLEQSTWAMHNRLEQIASDSLHMQVPDAKRIQLVFPKEGSVPVANTSVGAKQ